MASRKRLDSSDEHDVSLEDLVKFATGEADDQTHERVAGAMNDIRHPLSHLIRTKEEVLEEQKRARKGKK